MNSLLVNQRKEISIASTAHVHVHAPKIQIQTAQYPQRLLYNPAKQPQWLRNLGFTILHHCFNG